MKTGKKPHHVEIDYLLQRASLYTSGSVEEDIVSANVIDAHFRVVVFWVGFFFHPSKECQY